MKSAPSHRYSSEPIAPTYQSGCPENKTSHPRAEPVIGVGILAFLHPAEVDPIVCRIDERMASSPIPV